MESTMDYVEEKESEKPEQDSGKENENVKSNHDNVKEIENKNPGEAVGEVASVGEHHDSPCPVIVEEGTPSASQSDGVTIKTGTKENLKEIENKNPGEAVREVASVGDHNDSPCPMFVEEGTPFASNSDSVAIETGTKEDDLPKIDNETTHVDKNTLLENSPPLNPSPSAALGSDKGLVNPTVEALAEQTAVSSQVSSDISKNEGESAKVSRDTPVVHDKTAAIPDSKPTEDNVVEPVERDAKMVMEVDKASENDPVMPDTETMKDNENGIGEADTVNSADHVRGLADHHQETTSDYDKGSDVPGSETVSNSGNDPSNTDLETSTNLEKEPDLPVTDTLIDVDKNPDLLASRTSEDHEKVLPDVPATQTSSDHDKVIATQEAEPSKDIKDEVPDSEAVAVARGDSAIYKDVSVEPAAGSEKKDNSGAPRGNDGDCEDASTKHANSEPGIICVASSNVKAEEGGKEDLNNGVHRIDAAPHSTDGIMNSKHSFLLDEMYEGNESGTEEEQSAFMKELDNFFRERNTEFKPPKFYGEGLNCLKLWRSVTRLGGYDKVTACKLWRQVGESFRPPKTCTTVSWTFRGFYEKALLEYERHKVNGGELQIPLALNSEPMNIDNQGSGSGRARRDAAARAMQGWHSQRLLGNGEDKSSAPQPKREKQIGTPGLLKRKRPVSTEHGAKSAHTQVSKPLLDVTIVDVGPPADWVKINVQKTKDCFEVYALVPGLLREEVRVQSDPAGRLVISGEPENPDNLWGATPFKKVVSLPARIDPHHTSAVVTLNGQLFVRVPLEQSD